MLRLVCLSLKRGVAKAGVHLYGWRSWLAVAAISGAGVSLSAGAAGCSGAGSSSVGAQDAGGDATTEGGSGSEAGSETGPEAAGKDAGSEGSATDAGSEAGTEEGGRGEGGAREGGTEAGANEGGTEAGASEGGAEAGASEGGTEAGAGDGGPEAGSEAGSDAGACGVAPTACVNPNTSANDFCTSATNQCGACTDVTDDPNCQTAYGSTYICVSGACVVGNCHNSSDCKMSLGQVCGASVPNVCGACTGDLQCQNDTSYGPLYVCSAGGLCVSSSCTAANAACTSNPADFCCPAVQGGTTYTCVSGTCCTDTNTDGGLGVCGTGMTCQGSGAPGGTCTQCEAATGNTYYVNPATGSDSGHTGSSACPFKTITKAFEFIGTAATPGTIVELQAADPLSNGETFPLIVPSGVTVTGAYTVTVASGKVGFELNAPSSGLNGPTVDGSGNTGLTGIAVYGGSSGTTTQVQNVTVEGFAGPGITIGKLDNKATTVGLVLLGPGLEITANGTTTKNEPGVFINAGSATITGTAAAGSAGHTSIHGNTQHGILVEGTGSVNLNPGSTMVATAAGQAYVDLDGNSIAGLWISQAVGTAGPLTNAVNFVEVTGTMAGNGIHVNGGSSLMLRGSFVASNKDSGVLVGSNGKGVFNNDVSLIDLGDATTDGQNTLQGPLAGVCMAIAAPAAGAAGQTLSAVGNTWGLATGTPISCETTAMGGKLTHAATCAGAVDVGGIGTTSTGANTANVSLCTYQ